MLVAAGVSLIPAVAHAQSDDAEALFQEGRRLLKAGKIVEACPILQQSFDLRQGVATEFNLAECEEKLQHFATAYRHYEHVRVVSVSKGETERAEVAEVRSKAAKARAASVSVALLAPVPTEELRVDGELTPVDAFSRASVVLDPGTHDIEATADKHAHYIQKFSVTSGGRVDLQVPPLTKNAVPVSTYRPVPALKPGSTPVAPPVEAKSSGSGKAVGYILLGIGLGLGGGGAYLLYDANSKRAKLDEQCPGRVCPDTSLQGTYQTAKSENTAGIALAIGGGVVLISGLVVLVGNSGSSGGSTAKNVHLAPVFQKDGAGLAAFGRF